MVVTCVAGVYGGYSICCKCLRWLLHVLQVFMEVIPCVVGVYSGCYMCCRCLWRLFHVLQVFMGASTAWTGLVGMIPTGAPTAAVAIWTVNVVTPGMCVCGYLDSECCDAKYVCVWLFGQ